MKLVVAICTYNRAGLLRQTLRRMSEIRTPVSADWEIVVIDNCCTDETEQVVREFAAILPVISRAEPKPGLSNARNAAVAGAADRGATHIVWTDDDVLPDEDWLAAYETAFGVHADAAIFGGPIDPWFASTPPKWLERNWSLLQYAYAIRDLGTEEFPLSADGSNLPYGANYAIRMPEQRRKAYDPRLGLSGSKRIAGEETALIRELLSEGVAGWWVPNARVKHYLQADRLNLRYLGRYYRGSGRTSGRQSGDPRPLWRKPRWVWRRAIEHSAKLLFHLLLGNEERWLNEFAEANTGWGRLFDLEP
jgi:glycosyltransferase involved in cell wall biosynthesis